jgi:DNA-binding LytR/AlgR family response regulator
VRAHSRAVLAEDDHRRTIVNIDAVSGIARDFHGRMRVKLKARKECSP